VTSLNGTVRSVGPAVDPFADDFNDPSDTFFEDLGDTPIHFPEPRQKRDPVPYPLDKTAWESVDEVVAALEHGPDAERFRLFFRYGHDEMRRYPTDEAAYIAFVKLLLPHTSDDFLLIDEVVRSTPLSTVTWAYKRIGPNERFYRDKVIVKAALEWYREYLVKAEYATNDPGPKQDARTWPEPLGEAAYHGPLGAVVKGIAPYTEADPAALFAHAIVFAGAYIGRDLAIEAEDDEHPPRFYCCLVGNTSKGRKGTAAAPFRKVAGALQDSMYVATGLSSAEGLIKQVRDKVEKWDAKTQEWVVTDPGVTDKRLVLLETEFGGVLRKMQREGNALSATLREGWDYGNLATLVTHNPLKATKAHINLITHVTHEELKQCLADVEVSNGLVNRMLWFAVKRANLIPRSQHRAEVEGARRAFKDALEDVRAWVLNPAQRGRKVSWSDAAGAEYDALYPTLSAEHVGMFGQATQRAEAYVLRLCVLYAVLDKSMTVKLDHLHAALAVWKYCEDSARVIFAGNTGNPNADRILAALRSSGEMTRSAVSALFGRHLNAAAIQQALETLVNHGLATFEVRGTGSAQTEVWRAR
jgi:hypothetical protein